MAVTVYIPTPFRRATGNRDRIETTARDVGGVLDELERSFQGLRGLVRNEQGEIHRHVTQALDGIHHQVGPGPAGRLRERGQVSEIPTAELHQ